MFWGTHREVSSTAILDSGIDCPLPLQVCLLCMAIYHEHVQSEAHEHVQSEAHEPPLLPFSPPVLIPLSQSYFTSEACLCVPKNGTYSSRSTWQVQCCCSNGLLTCPECLQCKVLYYRPLNWGSQDGGRGGVWGRVVTCGKARGGLSRDGWGWEGEKGGKAVLQCFCCCKERLVHVINSKATLLYRRTDTLILGHCCIIVIVNYVLQEQAERPARFDVATNKCFCLHSCGTATWHACRFRGCKQTTKSGKFDCTLPSSLTNSIKCYGN